MRVLRALVFFAALAAASQSGVPVANEDALSVPQSINYQGFLTDSNGRPLNGSYQMSFALYDVETGGTTFWSESYDTVLVSEGVFDVLLGSVTGIPTVPDDGNCWLQVTVAVETIAPRVRLVCVPYAFQADNTGKLQSKSGTSYPAQSQVRHIQHRSATKRAAASNGVL